MLRIANRHNIILILLLALAIRLIGIAARPIWYDEAFSILFAEKDPSAMLFGTIGGNAESAAEEHPLTYYFLLWGWMKVFGSSLVAVRLLSVLAGVATVFVAHRLVRELFDGRLADIAALFISLAPFQIHYSQEIRMYSFLALWLLIATYAYQRASSGGSWLWWILFSFSAALAQYTHNLAAFFLVALAVWPLIRKDWKSLRAVSLAGLGALVLYMPWLIHLPSQFAKVSDAYWVTRPGIARLFTLLLVYVTNLPLPEGWLYYALFISLVVTAIAAMQTLNRKNRTAGAVWLMYLSFTPPALLFLMSQWIPVYIERALLPSGVVFCIWLAWAFFGTPMPRGLKGVLVGLLTLGALVGVYQHVAYRGFPYAPFRELNASLEERILPGDIIIHSSKATRLPMAYYDPSLPQEYIADPPGSNIDTLGVATQQVLGLVAQPDIASATRNVERVWFIVFQRHIDAYIQLGYKDHPNLSQLEDTFDLQTTETWGDLRVYTFARSSK
jgi:mannosyltransferase